MVWIWLNLAKNILEGWKEKNRGHIQQQQQQQQQEMNIFKSQFAYALDTYMTEI